MDFSKLNNFAFNLTSASILNTLGSRFMNRFQYVNYITIFFSGKWYTRGISSFGETAFGEVAFGEIVLGEMSDNL